MAHSAAGVGDIVGSREHAVLMFHGVDEGDSYYGSIPTRRFREIIEFVTESASVVPLSEINDRRTGRQVAITFDDGLKSFYSEAFPVLEEYDVPATVFVCPAFINDRNRETVLSRFGLEGEERIMMTDDEIAELIESPLITVGNHTRSHRKLTNVEHEEELRSEIVESKLSLEDRYDIAIDSFSYPYGAYDQESRQLVEDHHDRSVTTDPFLIGREGPHRMPRISAHKPQRMLEWELSPLGDRLNRYRHRIANS